MRITIPSNESQLKLLDQVVKKGTKGSTREEVLHNTLKEHVGYLLNGGTPYDNGDPVVLEVRKPQYGNKRVDIVLEPVTGKAVPVYTGEVLRIYQVVGGQCVDFNAYNLHDYKEWLDNGFNRQKGLFTGKGTIVWTGSPRGRPMYAILEAAETCDQFYAGHRCNAIQVERDWGLVDHPNCQDTFAEAIREYCLTPDDVHDSYNLWMHTELDPNGKRRYAMNRGRKDDYIDILSLFDTLAVPIVCGGDVSPVNNYDLQPIGVQVFEPTPSSMAVVEQIQNRFGRYRSQKTVDHFLQKEVRADRALRPDLSYVPQYISRPKNTQLDVDITPEEWSMLQSLVETGHYSPSPEKAMIIAFIKWFDVFLPNDRYATLDIKG